MLRLSALLLLLSAPSAALAQPAVEEVPPPPAEAEAPPAPKVAVVAVGDPDETLLAQAARVEEAAERLGYRRPADAGLRAVLQGGPSGDGLEPFAAARRSLGVDAERDRTLLARLGEQLGAAALLVVRNGVDAPLVAVFDTRAGRFFEGRFAVTAETPLREVGRFVRTRVRSAADGRARAAEAEALAEANVQQALEDAATEGESEETPEPSFLERSWPYFVIGALLAGLVVGVAVAANNNDRPQPVLRLVPGGD